MIARKPKKENQAATFIARGAGNGRGRRAAVRIITRFDAAFLERIDKAAEAMGLNRSAFIVSAVAERLRQLEE